jgi:transcription antitermination factor NusG
MPELLADSSSIFAVSSNVGERVRITRGPLEGLSGPVTELAGDEALVDLRSIVAGLFVRCRLSNLESLSGSRLG